MIWRRLALSLSAGGSGRLVGLLRTDASAIFSSTIRVLRTKRGSHDLLALTEPFGQY
jgi:hypothetical protein